MKEDYNFNKDTCWYKPVCNLYGTDECYAGCVRYMEMKFLMNSSLIPENRQYPVILKPEVQDRDAFLELRNLKDDVLNFVRSGESLYIHSEGFGNGKTTWALKIMHKYFDTIWSGNGFRVRALFIHVPTFMKRLTDAINKPDPNFENLKELLNKVDLVVWDDITACGLKEFTHNHLLSHIDVRVFNGLSNIYTGNLGTDNIEKMLGGRLASRIFNQSTVVEIKGCDRRGGNK